MLEVSEKIGRVLVSSNVDIHMRKAAMGKNSVSKQEKIYQEILQRVQDGSTDLQGKDIIIGIPFSDQIETLPTVIGTVNEGIQQYLPDKKVTFVIAGTHEAKNFTGQISALFKELAIHGHFFTLDKALAGKGWVMRALMELSASLGSDLILIEPDFVREGQEGIQPAWICSLYRPLELGMDFVLPVFTRPPEGKRVSDHLVIPLLVALYGYRVQEPMGGVYGIRKETLQTFLQDPKLFSRM